MKVGLVLGAGGVVGASWLMGALDALESETGWRAADAERIIGTSAGSVIGALAADGIEAAYMGAYASGGSLEGFADTERRAATVGERMATAGYRIQRALPPIGPGSWRLAASTLMHVRRHATPVVLAGCLPRVFVSTEPIKDIVRTFIARAWPDHPGYWAVGADYGSGRRVAFGREGAPPAHVADAVAASCAIPGFYHPVRIAGRRYVDGGICSPSNLDLLSDEELDLVVCLNPMSSLAQVSGGSPGDRVGALLRTLAGRRLGHEARKLRDRGTKVLMLQPGSDVLKVMGFNMMSGRRRIAVTQTATKSPALALRRLRVRDDTVLPARSRSRSAAPRRRSAAKRKPRAA